MDNDSVQARPGPLSNGSTDFLRESLETSEEKGRPSNTPSQTTLLLKEGGRLDPISWGTYPRWGSKE